LKYKILVRLRKKLSGERVTVYIGEDLTEQIEPPCIVVAPTTDQFDILRIEGTCEPKRDIETIDILNFLLVIDQQFGIDIMGATTRTIVFKLKQIPQGIEREEFRQWFINNTPFDYPCWVDIDDADLLEPIELYWED
jgi:hypothetical protein